jgi:hypothetical protein
MAEHVIRGELQVVPREEGGRHLAIADSPYDFYRIPLPPEQHERVAKELAMSDDELQAALARRQAAQTLIVPDGSVPVT